MNFKTGNSLVNKIAWLNSITLNSFPKMNTNIFSEKKLWWPTLCDRVNVNSTTHRIT